MGQGKIGWWVAGACAVVVAISIGYGMGRRAAAHSADSSSALSPAGAPPATVQIEPIQPQAELAAITVSPTESASSTQHPATSNQPAPASTPGGPGQPAPGLPVESSARVREIQQALKAAGFDPGPVDGRMGHKTQVAVRDFQKANHLTMDGKVGPRTWAKLESFLSQKNSQEKSSKPND